MSDEITRTVLLPDRGESLRLRRFVLAWTTGEGERGREEFAQRQVTIGTSPDNDVVLDDSSVSRRHCRIEVDARGYRVVDLDSKNGTRIGDVRVREAWLRSGQRIAVGETELRFDTTADEVEVRFSGRERFGRMLGRSLAMREIFATLERVSPTDATVLIQGRSGTGKELVAEAIHEHSPRRSSPFVVFDCSAVSADLIESELFGHVRGAFTGAVQARKGAFEQAQGGTLFIDELGELSPELQPKLLRALEKREIRRVGSNEVVPIDVRIVAATNRDLREEVARGTFREDLYYRFAVIAIHLPPLAERPDDIPLLVEGFLRELAERSGQKELAISWATMEKLKRHAWPGNIRELRNFVERAVVLSSGGEVESRFLVPASDPSEGRPVGTASGVEALMTAAGVDASMPFKEAKNQLVDLFERSYWKILLERTDGNVSKAARIAGVHRKSLEYILRKLDLDRTDLQRGPG